MRRMSCTAQQEQHAQHGTACTSSTALQPHPTDAHECQLVCKSAAAKHQLTVVRNVQDRSVRSGSDPVLWHCFGLTHIVRPEDFPVMPVESAGFTLKPVGFFRGNPAIDIPYQANAASKLCCGSANGLANGSAANGSFSNGSPASRQANGHTDE